MIETKAPTYEQPTCEEIRDRFTHHPPKDQQPRKYEILRERAQDMAYMLASLCPDSREKALALTKLEEVVMWANASIARNE